MELNKAIEFAKCADVKVLRKKFILFTDKTCCDIYETYLKAYETLAEQPEEIFFQYCTDGLMDCLMFLGGYLAYRYCHYVNGGKA